MRAALIQNYCGFDCAFFLFMECFRLSLLYEILCYMAKVKSFSREMVRDLSGVVDFYFWKGIPVARLWPRRSNLPPSQKMLGARLAFTQSRIDLRSVQGPAREAWAVSSYGKRQAWLDYYTSIYMRMWRDFRRFPPVVTGFLFSSE